MTIEPGYFIGAAVVLALVWIARRLDQRRHQADLDRIQQRIAQRQRTNK
ncbi:MAG: hypothetical protein AAGI24_10270 [Pseudomonadota bacterium]